MVITRIELEGTSIIEGIEIPEVRKFGRDGYGFFLFCLAIEDLYIVALIF
jgi:hypothetical protein